MTKSDNELRFPQMTETEIRNFIEDHHGEFGALVVKGNDSYVIIKICELDNDEFTYQVITTDGYGYPAWNKNYPDNYINISEINSIYLIDTEDFDDKKKMPVEWLRLHEEREKIRNEDPVRWIDNMLDLYKNSRYQDLNLIFSLHSIPNKQFHGIFYYNDNDPSTYILTFCFEYNGNPKTLSDDSDSPILNWCRDKAIGNDFSQWAKKMERIIQKTDIKSVNQMPPELYHRVVELSNCKVQPITLIKFNPESQEVDS
jgi:hypothetical protein